jgi:hypothetical protein
VEEDRCVRAGGDPAFWNPDAYLPKTTKVALVVGWMRANVLRDWRRSASSQIGDLAPARY